MADRPLPPTVGESLRYGADAVLRLDLPDGALLARCGQPRLPPLPDAEQAVRSALANPLDYPPLSQVAVAGDQVVLALGEGLPQAAAVTAALVESLSAAGIEPDHISVLRTFAHSQLDPSGPLVDLPAALRAQVRLLTHDPEDRNRLSYLAASNEAKPIFMNRALTEADLVIPVGTVRPEGSLAYYGVYSAVFPAFSDAKTIGRYRSPIAGESPVQSRRFRREVEEVSWLLGIHFLLEIVPGPGDSLIAVCAGQAGAVEQAGRQRCAQAWNCTVPGRAGLVIAALPGPAPYQTWANLARALAAATRVVEPGGAIALCTELDEAPGPALRALLGAADRDLVLRHIAHDRPLDTLAAMQLAQALEQCQVYLLSGLDHSLVEDLGITPIERPAQIARLAERHASCIVLDNAHYVHPTAAGDDHPVERRDTAQRAIDEARDEFE